MADILVVDNNEYITRLIGEVLTQEKHHVDTANRGYMALDMIKRNKYDISIIDLDLPDINGLNILKTLQEKSPQTVPIVISGQSNLEKTMESIKADSIEYLKKPFDIDELKNVTRTALRANSRLSETFRADKYSAHYIAEAKVDTIIRFTIDTIILTLALFLGFIIQQQIYAWYRAPLFWGGKEIIYLLLSFACCYSFIFVRGRQNSGSFYRPQPYKDDFKNFTSAYILFAAILFFVTSFYEARLALLIGYGVGFGLLSFNIFVLTPQLKLILSSKREGPKKLTIKNFTKLGKAKFEQLKEKYSSPETNSAGKDKPLSKLSDSSIPDKKKNVMQDKKNSSVRKRAFNDSQKSSLIEDFKNSRNLIKLNKMYRNNK